MTRNEYSTVFRSFKQLVGAGLLNESYDSDSPVISGYRFTMRLESGTGGQPPGFNVSADPHPADNWLVGKDHYYLASGAFITTDGDRPRPMISREPPNKG